MCSHNKTCHLQQVTADLVSHGGVQCWCVWCLWEPDRPAAAGHSGDRGDSRGGGGEWCW